jgi:hypothetical protein
MDDGQTVKDVKTNLIWTRCSYSQENNHNGACGGGRIFPKVWNTAQESVQELNAGSGYAGAKNWRIPTITEWATLRDCSAVSATTNKKTVEVFGQKKTIEETVDAPKFSLRSQKSTVLQDCPTLINAEVFPNTPMQQGIYFSSTRLSEVNKGTAELHNRRDESTTLLTMNNGSYIGTLDLIFANAYVRYVRTSSK